MQRCDETKTVTTGTLSDAYSDKDKMLLSGVQVNVKEKLSLHASIIDKSVVWYGSVNYLGYNAEDNHTMRIMESSIAEEVIEILYE